MAGYVYLLCDKGKDNTFKIGVTRGKIENRIKKLQTGNSEEIFLSNYYETECPFFIERLMHDKYFKDRKIGEWFTLDNESIINFKEDCKEFEKMADTLKNNPFMKNKIH